ncbi:MAG: ribosome small subunit-dependent GTPase A [Fimbriimonadaceae bacterium]
MNKKLSNKLNQDLAHLSEDQIDNLVLQAHYMRKRSGSKQGTMDDWVMRVIRKNQRTIEKATDVLPATVASVRAREILLELESGFLTIEPGNFQVVVGDLVSTGILDGERRIVLVEERKTKLSRPEVKNARQEQLIAANIDVVVIVVSVVSPPLHPRLIDRYLVAVQNGGALPVICVNKLDLLEDPAELALLEPYRKIGVAVFDCSCKDLRGLPAMREALAGKTVVFVGHSGVGKSSLANAFAPELGLKTGKLSDGYGRGMHTTTTSSMHRLENGTTMIDTPGIRSFGLWDSGEDEIAAAFGEFAKYECKFRDCRHIAEPECGVVAAVERGEIAQERYDTYRRMIGEVGSG